MRRYGETRKPEISYRMRPGAYAILLHKNRILLTHQSKPYDDFQLPGGGIDPMESPIAALHREVLEETGWRIAKPQFYRAYRRFLYMPDYDMWAEKICKIYMARPIRPLCAPMEQGHTAHWLSIPEGLKVLRNHADKEVLGQLLSSNIQGG